MSHLNINGVDKPLDHIRLNNVRSEQLASSYNATGYVTQYNAALFANFDIKPNTEYTLSFDALQGATLYTNEHIFTSSAAFVTDGSRYHVTLVTKSSIPEDQYISGLGWLLLKNALTLQSNPQISNVMLNLGSIALPYQPYLITKEAWEARSRVILHGLTNPLCGINTHKDTLDLSTGPLTRYVKRWVLTGNEHWQAASASSGYRFSIGVNDAVQSDLNVGVKSYCSHFQIVGTGQTYSITNSYTISADLAFICRIDSSYTIESFKQWLASEYSAGHPVIIWYILATPETETITVPSNLTGIVEGYLTRTGTPTPTNPIYPIANGNLEQDGTYSLDTGAYAIAWGRADTFTGTNSISARCYGLPVKSLEIDGNSQQSGTPTQDNPIMPEFVGERTANLFDKNNSLMLYNGYISIPPADPPYAVTPSTIDSLSIIVPVEPNSTYTISKKATTRFRVGLFTNYPVIGSIATNIYGDREGAGIDYGTTLTFSTSSDTTYIMAFIRNYDDTFTSEEIIQSVMVNEGTEPLPYEPYGYKLNITSAGHTQTVYLGQVQTTRRVKKMVFDGTENWFATGGGDTLVYNTSLNASGVPDPAAGSICTHLEYGDRYTQGQYDIGESGAMRISAKGFESLSAFKQFLVDEYANGMPVTVWYVLATPETAITNEPLAKIGAYADTLTSEQAGITIQTVDGSTTISVDTTLAPSSFEVEVHAKPIHYGFKIDKAVSNPSNAVIYTHDAVTMTPAGMDFTNGVFNYGSWKNVWFIKNARPVMLNFDGTEAYDLDPNNYSKKLDGTPSDIADSTKNMNAMIAFPTVWIKRTDDASYNYIEISDRQLDSDFHAYAHENASGVVKPYIYLPIYKGSLIDGKLRSISGVKPISYTTAQQEVDAASALGTGWQIWDYTSKEMLCDLLTLISKSLATQDKFGQGKCADGISPSDFLDCGTLNDKGKFFGHSNRYTQVKCFGMEALWADRWDRELGLILDSGIYKIKEHPTYNLTGEGYTAISTSVAKCPTTDSFIKTEVSTQFGSLPTVVGGTSSTYYCDDFHQNQSDIRVAIRGGNGNASYGAGLRCVHVGIEASTSYWSIGASPVYK